MSDIGRPLHIREAAISGVVSALALLAALAVLGDLLGSFGDSDATFVEYYEDNRQRAAAALGGVLLFVGGIALNPFLNGLLNLLDPDRRTWRAVLVGSMICVASGLLVVAAAALGATSFTRITADAFDESGDPLAGASVAILPQLGYVLFVFAAWAIAFIFAAVSSLILSTRALPAAFGWLGLVCAALLILSPAIGPVLSLPLWVLALSVKMLGTPRAGPAG